MCSVGVVGFYKCKLMWGNSSLARAGFELYRENQWANILSLSFTFSCGL